MGCQEHVHKLGYRTNQNIQKNYLNLEPLTGHPSKYDYVFLGYPIWWDLAPRTVNTSIETANLAGKTVIPFATSGSSTIANSVAVLKKSYPKNKWQTGKLLNHVSEKEMETWVSETIK